MKQPIVVVAAPRSGVDVLTATLISDASWLVSAELTEKLDQIGVDLADSGQVQILPDSTDTVPGEIEDNRVELCIQPDLSMKISEIAKAYPETKFIYLTRSPIEGIRSSLLGWRSKRFVTHQDLPGWWGEPWSFTLVPNWADLIGLPIPEIAANQWFSITEQIIFDLNQLPTENWLAVSYEELLLEPAKVVDKVKSKFGLPWDGNIKPIPLNHATDGITSTKLLNRTTVEVADALAKFPSRVNTYQEFRSGHISTELVEQFRTEVNKLFTEAEKNSEVTRSSSGTPFSYQHSPSFTEILAKAKASIAITTYKSGHLIFVRADKKEKKLNCYFKSFNKPMGMAVSGNRFAIGTQDSLQTFTNQPALAAGLKSEQVNDVLYFPRATVNTGDIAIHEMAYGVVDDQVKLWFINTRFSCLCTMDPDYSFEPVWRPSWITELAAEDRCHLNGLAMVNGKPRYVSALSQTNTRNGWRELKGTSGVIIDLDTNEVVVEGLSMPHSPRWYRDELWVLESGKGTLAKVNPYSGDVTTVATLPGFTRGLTFIDRFAFIGLSQVRESVFSELPVTQTKDERNCGVWVVDITTGNIVALLKFDGAVQELFDVAVIPNAVWPRLETDTELTQSAFVLSDAALKQVNAPISNQIS